MIRLMSCVALTMLAAVSTIAADPALEFTTRPRLTFDARDRSWQVTFELSRFTDVEVAIVDPEGGKVLRHLAAGVLGDHPPPPLIARSLRQMLRWDGKDDDGKPVKDASQGAVRVRAGMRVALKQIVGGDPYGYYSRQMPHGDHSPWGINGLELKADGKVYVLGHSSTLGPPAVRQFDIHGNYIKTVFPPPAGQSVESMKGWGIHVKPDGTYTPRFNRLTDPSVSTTILDTATNGMARLMPTPTRDTLTAWHTGGGRPTFELLTFNTDGTIGPSATQPMQGALVLNPAMKFGPVEPDSHIMHALIGPVFTSLSPDGRHFYLSGMFSARTRYGTILQIEKEGFWRDGQVWKVDMKTRTARVFFALDEAKVAAARRDRESGIGGRMSYAALHGVAVDPEGHVFIADRLNSRIIVLDADGKTVREIGVKHPDAVAVSARTGSLYVNTRIGDEITGRGEVRLLKFADWRESAEAMIDVPISETGYTDHHKHSYLVLCEDGNATNVWVAYTELPVRVYKDDGSSLKLIRDFSGGESTQQCFGFDRIDVDPQTDEVFVLDDHSGVWKVSDWEKPTFIRTPLETASIAIDARRRHIYIRTLHDGSSSNSTGKVARFHLDKPDFPPANLGETGSNRLTPPFQHEWCFTGNGDKGFAIAPNGNIAIVGDPRDGLRLFHGDERRVPWEAVKLVDLPHAAGGVRFDLAGNLYVGIVDPKQARTLPGFEDDPFAAKIGRIYKYAPTGTLESGNLFPTAPLAPSKVYDVPFGAFDVDCIVRTPRFAVDAYGRIAYPTNIAQRVTLIDNAGNEILSFGTYGNRDSMGGLPSDLVTTKDIPMAFPNSVAVTDDYIYVGDMVNIRLLRIEKQFALEATSGERN